jgi:serine/threonine protein kinase
MTANLPELTAAYGQYDVERVLGRGAMGTVYLARDRRIGRRVALKTIRVTPDRFSDEEAAADFFRRLQREAEVSGSLLHPNIVTLYEAGYEDGRISYLAMELVEGETLLALIKRLRPEPVPVDAALRIAEDLLRALAHAHAKGIIHRDIKPANILIAGDGTAKLADFGIARPQDSSMTGAGALLGTPNYMSPEQVLGKTLTTQSDLFSLGVVLYEMLTTVKPFAAEDMTTILHNILRLEVGNVSEVREVVPRAVGDFIAELMRKESDARPATAEALEQITALRGGKRVVPASMVDTVRSGAVLVPQPAPLLRRRLSRRHAAIAISAVIAAAALPAAFIATRIDPSPTVTISQSQLDEFAAKRRELDDAHTALASGHYEESVQRYDAYLQKYPYSAAARDGRAQALAAIEKQQKAKAAAAKPKPKPKPEDEDISPSEMLQRIKRAFRRG